MLWTILPVLTDARPSRVDCWSRVLPSSWHDKVGPWSKEPQQPNSRSFLLVHSPLYEEPISSFHDYICDPRGTTTEQAQVCALLVSVLTPDPSGVAISLADLCWTAVRYCVLYSVPFCFLCGPRFTLGS